MQKVTIESFENKKKNKMKITRIVKIDNDKIEATMALSMEQAQFLLNTGIAFLLQTGAASFMDVTPEEFLNQGKKEETLDVPTSAPKNVPQPV